MQVREREYLITKVAKYRLTVQLSKNSNPIQQLHDRIIEIQL